MKLLVACEESQAVCKAFRARGHEAYSCDIIECSGGHPEWHIRQDVLPLLNGYCEFDTMDGNHHVISDRWDMIIAHPPCTYLTSCGASRLFNSDHSIKNRDRLEKGIIAKDFFMRIFYSKCEHICIENPAPIKLFHLPPYSQIIEPYMFGHPWKKRTCLWLRGLSLLESTDIVSPKGCWVRSSGPNSRTKLLDVLGVFSDRERSRTFPGIATAMAEQWG